MREPFPIKKSIVSHSEITETILIFALQHSEGIIRNI